MNIVENGVAFSIDLVLTMKEVVTEDMFGLEIISPDGTRSIFKNADITFTNFVSPAVDANGVYSNGSLTISSLTFSSDGIFTLKFFKEGNNSNVTDLLIIGINVITLSTSLSYKV